MTTQEIIDIFTKLSPVLAGASKSAGDALVKEAIAANNYDQTATSRYQALVNASRLSNVEQPMANARQVGLGTLMETWKPVSVTPSDKAVAAAKPTITGGPTYTDNMRTMGSSLASSALARQQGGNTLNTSAFPSGSDLGLTPIPEASWLDKTLGYASTLAGVVGAFAPKAGATAATTAGTAASAAPAGVASSATGGTIMSNGTVVPASPTGSGITIPLGGGSDASANPQTNWTRNWWKGMQNNQGASQYMAGNPFQTGSPWPGYNAPYSPVRQTN